MFLLPSLLASLLTSAAPPAKSNLTVSLCNAGEHQQFETVSCDIELKNSGDNPIHISNARAMSHWDSIEQAVVVPARATAYLHATVQIIDSIGFVHRFFGFTTDEPGALASRGAQVQVFASTVLDTSAPSIDFNTVKLDEPLPTKTITLTSREVRNFRVLGILSKPDYIGASIGQDGKTVDASLHKDAPWGMFHEPIKVKINAPQQPEAWIKVEGNVQGDVVPDVNPVLMGLMRTNKRNEFLIRLTNRTGKDFKTGAIVLKGIKGSTAMLPCEPKANGCRVVRLTIAKDQTQGRVSGVLSVELPEFKQILPIELGAGLLLGPEVEIRDMKAESDKSLQKQGKLQSAVETPVKQEKLDVKQAIDQSIQRTEQDVSPPSGKGPLLRWSVAHQVGYHGYIIYRADAEDGPFLRVNQALVPMTSGEGGDSGSYQWRDNTAESGKTYWYSIGLVKDDGDKEPLSGAQKVLAK